VIYFFTIPLSIISHKRLSLALRRSDIED
jgi:hypothetical protein